MDFMIAAALLLLPDAIVFQPYSAPAPAGLSARCSSFTAAARVVDGSIPVGLSLGSRGELWGLPQQIGSYSFELEVFNGCSRLREKRHLKVVPAPILIVNAERLDYEVIEGAPAAEAGVLSVSGSLPGNAYRIDTAENWLSFRPWDGAVPGANRALESDTVELVLAPKGLPPGRYSSRVRFSSWGSANTPQVTVNLRVIPQRTLMPALLSSTLPFAPPPGDILIPPAAGIIPPPPVVRQPQASASGKSRTLRGRGSALNGRSRVLAFPKVHIAERPKASETSPERTKPSAMPPPVKAPAKP